MNLSHKPTQKIIKTTRLIDGTGRDSLTNQAVVIQSGRIKDIKPWNNDAIPEDAEIIDLGAMTLLPGFIDAHLHLTLDPRIFPAYDPARNNAEIALLSAGNAQAILRAGVTTVCDLGAENEIIFAVRDAIENGEIIGPRVLTSGYVITVTEGHGDYFGKAAGGVEAVRRAVAEQVEAGADLIKVMATGGGGDGPGQSYYSTAELQAIMAEADRLGVRVAAHCHGVAGIKNCVEIGLTRIEHCSFYGDTGSEFDEDVARAIVKKGIYICPTNSIDYRRIQAGGKGAPRDELNVHWRKLLDLGATFVAGSDAGVTDMFHNDYALILKLMVTELGMSPMQAILSGTKVAAEALGLGDEIGTVEVGKCADLVAVKGNPLEDITALCQVGWVMRGSNVVFLN